MERKTNTCAIVGFILSFFCGFIGLIVSIIALAQIKKTGEKGKGFAIAGIVLPLASLVITVLIGVFYFVFVIPSLGDSIQSATVCAYGSNYSVGYYGQPGYIDCDGGSYDSVYTCRYTNASGDVETITCSN